MAGGFDILHQPPQEGRLSRPGFPRQQQKSLVLTDTGEQGRVRLLIERIGLKEIKVRGIGKRVAAKAKMFSIDGQSVPSSCLQ